MAMARRRKEEKEERTVGGAVVDDNPTKMDFVGLFCFFVRGVWTTTCHILGKKDVGGDKDRLVGEEGRMKLDADRCQFPLSESSAQCKVDCHDDPCQQDPRSTLQGHHCFPHLLLDQVDAGEADEHVAEPGCVLIF